MLKLSKKNTDLKKLFENRKKPEDEKTTLQKWKKTALQKIKNTPLQKLKKAPIQKICITKYSKSELFTSEDEESFLLIQNFSLWTETGVLKPQQTLLLDNINLEVKKYSVLGIIGPSGAGKSLLLSSIIKEVLGANAKNSFKCNGKIIFKGTEIISTYFPVEILRRKIGWIAQSPVLFPLTIRENILFALRARNLYNSQYLEKKLQDVLTECGLWEELKDRLDSYPIDTLSQGQAQRLCIARALILEPELLLMDEPTSALDPASTSKIEQLILNLSKKITIILVSHSMSQIMHVAEYSAFIKGGKIIEHGTTQTLFTSPKTRELKHFISGQY